MQTGLIKKDTVNDIVTRYQESIKEIKAAYILLERSDKRLNSITDFCNVFPKDCHIYGGIEKEVCDKVCQKIKGRIWRRIFNMTQAGELMTAKRRKEFDDAIEKPESLPEITHETITDFVKNLHDSAPEMVMEFIKETFNFLRPGQYSANQYKTNKKSQYELKEKIIKQYVMGASFGGFAVRYDYEKDIQSMDNAFSMVDGKGVSKFPGNALTAIRKAKQDGYSETKTEYFNFKWYNNGNLHIRFRRMDLVDRINQIAGKGLLKPKGE